MKSVNKSDFTPELSDSTSDFIVLEESSLKIKLNSVSKGGNFYETNTNIGNL